jgi:hypothetical protein
MDTQVRFLFLALLAVGLGGCSEEHAELLAPAPRPQPELTILVGEVEIARFQRQEGIEWLCAQLPPAEREQLLAEGSCLTRDPGFKAAVIELLGREPEAQRGFAGLNPRVVTWGWIKVHYS